MPVAIAGMLFFIFLSIALPVNAAKVECSVGIFSFAYVPEKDRHILKKVNSIKCSMDTSMLHKEQATIDQCLKQAGFSQQIGVYAKDLECSGGRSEKSNENKVPSAAIKPTTPTQQKVITEDVLSVDEVEEEIKKVIAPIIGQVGNIIEKSKRYTQEYQK